MASSLALIRLLADGQVHAGPELAASLGCSRAAVWKQLQAMPELGLTVSAMRGRGYQLSPPLELLDAAKIRTALTPDCQARIAGFELAPVMASTSRYLVAKRAPPAGKVQVALAEFQTAGRGRRGRDWVSPFGSGICLSLGWTLDGAPGGVAGLSLALGVAAEQALSAVGAAGVRLKWPNDLVAGGRKLGGLLLDVAGEADGPMHVVAGIGINVYPHAALETALNSADALVPVALAGLCEASVSRNEVAASLINGLTGALARYQADGFGSFADRWRELDVLHGELVRVQVGADAWQGRARGIGADGALLVERDGQLQAVMSGEVTVRTQA
ncbi:MAG: biotin--[acetyl-CoA-carboxylase] ligase [Gammaproteobacteria bacterium]